MRRHRIIAGADSSTINHAAIESWFADSFPAFLCLLGFFTCDSFVFLQALRGAMRPHYTPKLKKRTALLRGLKEVFRRYRSQPIDRVINLINPMLRGWVNYFAVGHSSECFSYIKDWVEKKVRRHLAHARKRKGFC